MAKSLLDRVQDREIGLSGTSSTRENLNMGMSECLARAQPKQGLGVDMEMDG